VWVSQVHRVIQKYLGVELTSDLAYTADIDAKLSRGRSTFTSLSKVFCSSALSVKLRVKLFQTLIIPTVLHGCECWTLSRAVCDKLNVFQSRVVFEPYWELSGKKTTCRMKQFAYVAQLPSHWLNSSGCVDSAGLVMSYAMMN